jgi:hypothetical protein
MRQYKVNVFDRLDDTQSVATLDIYWGGGGLTLQGIPFTTLILSGLLIISRAGGHLSDWLWASV